MMKYEIEINGDVVDKMEEECGIFAMYSPKLRSDLAALTYYGLYSLQHRGQESAGMTMCDTFSESRIRHKTIKNMGLVSEVFSVDDLRNYTSNIIIGHVRYSTTGSSNIQNCQPLGGESMMGKISIAHNGNLVNIQRLKNQLYVEGSLFQSTSDTELILKLIAKNAKYGIKEAVTNMLSKITGSFALVMIINDKLVAVRDAQGIRPLCLGKKDNDTYVFASETCALDTIGATFIRDVEPGEVIIISSEGLESFKFSTNTVKAPCSFEYIYFARPDSVIDGIDVHTVRYEAGKCLYEQQPVEADVVIGVPDSGIAAAIGYAKASGIEYSVGLVKNKYMGRTFISPTQELREISVKVKLNPIKKVIEGKRVVVVDDSLVRGTTSKKLIKMLFDAGAKEVHFRLASPIVISECYFGIDISNKKELIGSFMTVNEIKNEIGADSLEYLSLDNLKKILHNNDFCMGCFTGQYPIANLEK